MSDLKTILIIGDAPRLVGYNMVRKFLDAGYKVKAPDRYVYATNGNKGPALNMDYGGDVYVPRVQDNDNFIEIEYNPTNEKKLKEILLGCYVIVYLTSIFYDYSYEINSNIDGLISHESLASLAGISKTCGVHQFIYGVIPIMYCNKDDPEVTEDVHIKGLTDYSNYYALWKEYLKELATEQFVVTIVLPRILERDSHWGRLDFNITTITSHTINKSRTRFFGNSKKQIRPIPIDKDVMTLHNLRSDVGYGKCESYISEFRIKAIIDLCLFILEHPADKVNKKNWLYRVMYQCILEHFYFGRYLVEFLRKPRVPFLRRTKFVARTIRRLFDVSMMMFLLHVWPEQVYRFSTRKLLPNKSERFNTNVKPTVPFELIKEKTSNIQRMKEINLVMRGASFDISCLDNLKGPTYLVNFGDPIETQKDVIYMDSSISQAYRLQQLGLSVCQVEVNRIAENGKTFPPDSYLNLNWYEKLLDKPNFKRIAIAEKICRPFRLPLSSSWRPAGAGLNAICALSYFADKINVYGWDFYLESSPDDMSYWKLFSNLYKFRLDVCRSRLHFECALINYYYGYHLSKLNNIKNYGYMGQLNRHEKLIRKIERVLFNVGK